MYVQILLSHCPKIWAFQNTWCDCFCGFKKLEDYFFGKFTITSKEVEKSMLVLEKQVAYCKQPIKVLLNFPLE